jgi:plasmid stabilization system protein ParE
MTSGELHDEAKAELAKAAAYLEKQRRGYGERFIAAFESAREFVMAHPRSGRPQPLDVRAWSIQGFSYSIVYTIEDDDVLHHRNLSSPPPSGLLALPLALTNLEPLIGAF